jgi:hypothetical protein
MASVYYIQTSDPEQVVRVPSRNAGPITIEPAEQLDLDFHLVNTLRASSLDEAAFYPTRPEASTARASLCLTARSRTPPQHR